MPRSMESDAITWKVVPNTVAERMIDLSLIHELVPCRRLSRRNKVTNVTIKQFALKTYSQYIKIKTSVLRNLSDDSEIDDNVSFTEDDYSILYKSDASLKDYLSNTSRNYSFVTELETDEDDAAFDTESQDTFTQLPKCSPSRSANTGEERSKDKGISAASSSTPKTNTSSFTRLNAAGPSKRDVRSNAQTSFNKKTRNVENEVPLDHLPPITSKTTSVRAQPFHQLENLNKTKRDRNRNSSDKLTRANETQTETESKIDGRIHSKKNAETDTRKGRKKNSAASSLSDFRERVQNRHDSRSSPSADVPFDRSRVDFQDENSSPGNAYVNERKYSKYQPKDSGIEEDTEEELQVHDKDHYVKPRSESEREESPLIGSPVLNRKSTLTNFAADLESERCDSPNRLDAAVRVHQDATSDKEEYNKKARKRKALPKITCTEIVKKKYKIIHDASASNELVDLENFDPRDSVATKSRAIPEIRETEEAEPTAEDTSSWCEKRLQQLRRLNLTQDSDSSDNEKDDSCGNVENTRDEPIERAVVRSDGLSIEDRSENPKRQVSVHLNKRSRNSKDNASRRSDNVNVEAGQRRSSPRLTSPTSSNVREQENAKPPNVNTKQTDHIAVAVANKRSAGTARPCKLEEFARMESLVDEVALPSFTFEDIQEDELFIIDVPSVLLEAQLKGKRIVLKKEKLKIGKQKYRIKWMDASNVSCVFASGNPANPCKAVNLKPKARIVTRERILRSSTVKR